MRLQSQRLILFPLTLQHLILYLQGDNVLEKKLHLKEGNRSVPEELTEAFHQTILPAVADPAKNYLFSTLWSIVDIESNEMVADLSFKGEPDEQGEIEIGYGTYDPFQSMGYMTEAIECIIGWAFQQPNVKAIIAETESTNIASHRTLEKNNFHMYNVNGEMVWWRLDKNPIREE